jgi:predicted transcriptional regulator
MMSSPGELYDVVTDEKLGPTARLVLVYFHLTGAPLTVEEVQVALNLSRNGAYHQFTILKGAGLIRKHSTTRYEVAPT